MKLTKVLVVSFFLLFTTLAFPWGSELCQGCRIDSSALAGPIYTWPNSVMLQQMISTNGTFLFQDDINLYPQYSNGIKLEIRTQNKSPLRLAYDTNNYVDFSVGSSGSLTINATGGVVISANGNVVVKNGNVGIGVVTPTEALEVSGNIKLSGMNSRILNVPAPVASGDIANKDYVDASTADNAKESSLTDIKGTGFTPANASLKVLSDKIALQSSLLDVEGSGFVSASNSLKAMSDAIYGSYTNGSVIANTTGNMLQRLKKLESDIAAVSVNVVAINVAVAAVNAAVANAAAVSHGCYWDYGNSCASGYSSVKTATYGYCYANTEVWARPPGAGCSGYNVSGSDYAALCCK